MKQVFRIFLYFISLFAIFNVVGLLFFHMLTDIEVNREIINMWVIKSLPVCLFSTAIIELSRQWKQKHKTNVNKEHHEKPL
jgi:hypothetical protein